MVNLRKHLGDIFINGFKNIIFLGEYVISMEILKYGKQVIKNDRWIKKCHNCKSKLVYEDSDIKLDTNMDLYIECPICEEKVAVGMFDRKYNPKKHGECIPKNKKIGFGD